MLDHSTKTDFRLLVSSNLSAKENMAIDEVLLSSFKEEDLPIFRIYFWEKSCTIGVSQDFSTLHDLDEYKNAYAKRITGGGILFHGNDISYSLIIPASYMQSLKIKESYEKICTFLLAFYKSIGLDANYAKYDKNIVLNKHEYCQVGFEEYDILINSKKIGGNAQRRKKNVIFQHGSIAINKDESSKEFGNCLEDFYIFMNENEVQEKLIEAFKNTFNITFIQSSLSEKEKVKVKGLL